MKTRRHHNNRGDRQVRTGRTRKQVAAIARRLGVPAKSCDHRLVYEAFTRVDHPGYSVYRSDGFFCVDCNEPRPRPDVGTK